MDSIAASPKDRAIAAAGGPRKLAKKLSQTRRITHSAICQWKRVPAERVIDVEGATGVSRYELRPDIYPAPEAAA